MREILFRGKREETLEWVEGDLLIDSCKDVSMREDHCTLYYDILPETVGQYTGLTDKNGKKIFEGDIVNDNTSGLYGKVVYATPQDGYDGLAGFMVDGVYDGLQNYNGFWHLVDIIGNIHDNPEWTIVTVIIAIVGLIGTVAVPLMKNTKAMTQLYEQIKLLAYRIGEEEKDLDEFKKKASDRHEKIFTELEEHTDKLGDHEHRIQNLENQK